ncbi:hypothetical protein E2C01_077463 [Portunus trituberculatus]|uniref:Uncharacterized protein n=1 Tax=Portunus trituberculatus TaxID=210409 RepID=A0A5B7IBH8_PORTR|nr:hypothetical protein [Portunus trituberculatus]
MIIQYSQSPLKYVDSILKMSLARCGPVSARTGMYFWRLMELILGLPLRHRTFVKCVYFDIL